MLLRRRSPPPDVPAADRIVAILAGNGGGWVPPEAGAVPAWVRGAAAAQPGPVEPDEPVVQVEPAVQVEPVVQVEPAVQVEPVEPAVQVEPVEPLLPPVLHDLDGTGVESAGRLLPVPPGTPRPASGAHRLPGRLAAALPVPLRTGRVVAARRAVLGLVLLGVLAAVLTAGVLLRGRPQEVVVPELVATGQPMATPTRSPGGGAAAPGGEVVVAVAGTVTRPGLVRLPAGSRVADALAAAGGPVPGTESGLLNLARRLVDGEQVLVGVEPPAGSPSSPAAGGARGSSATGGPAAPGGLVDLNTATAADLDGLPGIGPVLAQRIVDWRTDNDRFGSVEQLREVTGIGEAKFQDLRERVTV